LGDTREAYEIYYNLYEISRRIKKALGMLIAPTKPVFRIRPWVSKTKVRVPVPYSGSDYVPKGIVFHYTGGASGLKSMRWANDPRWGNTGSSWHLTIFDRVPDNKVGELWDRYAGGDIQELFPVPTIMMASWFAGTWHANWFNKWALGFENRNTGCNKLSKHPNNKPYLGKPVFVYGERLWEPYGRNQLVANINAGRLANTMFGLDPDYILPHQCIWSVKSDTGPAFPMHWMRKHVCSHSDVNTVVLDASPDPTTFDNLHDHDDGDWEWLGVDHTPRVDIDIPDSPDSGSWVGNEEGMMNMITLGFNAGRKVSIERMGMMIKWFQRSTAGWQTVKKYRNKPKYQKLKVTGVFDKATLSALDTRIDQLGY
jgi:hypothetical protein